MEADIIVFLSHYFIIGPFSNSNNVIFTTLQ